MLIYPAPYLGGIVLTPALDSERSLQVRVGESLVCLGRAGVRAVRRCRGDIARVYHNVLQGEEDVGGVVPHLLGHVAAMVDDENGS